MAKSLPSRPAGHHRRPPRQASVAGRGGGPRPAAKRIEPILGVLQRTYPDTTCSLAFSNPLELLVATILSAQCTDVLVNKATAELFKKYKTTKDYAGAELAQLERDIARVNFYRNKAKSMQLACQTLV